jgi:hypothetical protein
LQKKTRKCQKECKKWICTRCALHRGHDDYHRATMRTGLAPKEPCASSDLFEANLLHRGHDGSEARQEKL